MELLKTQLVQSKCVFSAKADAVCFRKENVRRSLPGVEDVYTPNAAPIVPLRIEAKYFFQLRYFLNFENVL